MIDEQSQRVELAKVICEVSVLPSLVTPLLEVETSACATVADYAPPAVPPAESVLESQKIWDAHGCRISCRDPMGLIQTRVATCSHCGSRFRR